MAISWLFYTNLQNKTHCVGFFTRTYKTKYTTDGSLFLRDRKKSQHKYITSKGLSGLENLANN